VFTDDHLRVKGSDGTIFACGDAATIHYPNALELANELFDKADGDKV
jgi:NADH:ubiquinone reductase (non-electrogenic)